MHQCLPDNCVFIQTNHPFIKYYLNESSAIYLSLILLQFIFISNKSTNTHLLSDSCSDSECCTSRQAKTEAAFPVQFATSNFNFNFNHQLLHGVAIVCENVACPLISMVLCSGSLSIHFSFISGLIALSFLSPFSLSISCFLQ